MALQRAGAPGIPVAPGAPPVVTSAAPALSTRETTNRPFVELGVMFGQALGGREPVMVALTNLQNIGAEHGCDAIVAVKLLHYPTAGGPAVVAYGTGVRFLPDPAGDVDLGGAAAADGMGAEAEVAGAIAAMPAAAPPAPAAAPGGRPAAPGGAAR